MNGLRAGKYTVKALSILVELLILVVVAGPMVGAISPELGTQSNLGLGIQLGAIQPQVQQVFSQSSIVGVHQLVVPAFNNWPLPGKASLTLSIVDGNKTLYTSQPGTVSLAPFKSGDIDVPFELNQSLVTQIQGQTVGIGGSMSVSEGQFWTITVSLSQS